MTSPAPGHSIGTPYGKRGQSWSCDANSGGGVHTGVDYPCPTGTSLAAAISGTIRHRSYGSAFGGHQFAISPSPGQPFAEGEVFYAHCRTRLPDGTEVAAGDFVAESGAEGNVTGPHLHFEYHPSSKGAWSCGAHADPAPVIASGGGAPPPPSGGGYPAPTSGEVRLSRLRFGQQDSDSVWYLQRALNGHSLMAPGDITLDLVGDYGPLTDQVVRADQEQHMGQTDPEGASFVGPQQAAHIFAGSGLTIINDL